MGLGDVKMLGMVGALLGPAGVVVTVLLASVSGSIVGARLDPAEAGRQRKTQLPIRRRSSRSARSLAWFFGEPLVDLVSDAVSEARMTRASGAGPEVLPAGVAPLSLGRAAADPLSELPDAHLLPQRRGLGPGGGGAAHGRDPPAGRSLRGAAGGCRRGDGAQRDRAGRGVHRHLRRERPPAHLGRPGAARSAARAAGPAAPRRPGGPRVAVESAAPVLGVLDRASLLHDRRRSRRRRGAHRLRAPAFDLRAARGGRRSSSSRASISARS